MINIENTVNAGVEEVIRDFIINPWNYFTEEDVRWRIIRKIE